MIDKQLLIVGFIGAIAATAVGAVAGYRIENSGNYAVVLDVSPITKTVSVPLDECNDQLGFIQHPTEDLNQIAGIVTGGYSGKKVQQGMQDWNVGLFNQRNCATTFESRQEQVGYVVTYRINGQERTIRMNDDPGRRIRIENGKPVIV